MCPFSHRLREHNSITVPAQIRLFLQFFRSHTSFYCYFAPQIQYTGNFFAQNFDCSVKFKFVFSVVFNHPVLWRANEYLFCLGGNRHHKLGGALGVNRMQLSQYRVCVCVSLLARISSTKLVIETVGSGILAFPQGGRRSVALICVTNHSNRHSGEECQFTEFTILECNTADFASALLLDYFFR